MGHCSCYYYCCSKNSVFDVVLAVLLVLPVRAQNQGNSGQPRRTYDPCGTVEIRCNGRRWTMPYPENCTQYINCTGRADKSLMLEDCPAGEFFDTGSLECRSENYQCQSPCPDGAYSEALASSADSAQTSSTISSVTRIPPRLSLIHI